MSHGVWTERFPLICNTDPITRRSIFQSDFGGYVGMFHTHYPAKFRASLYILHTDKITTVNVHGVFNLHTFPPKWTYSSSTGLGIRMTHLTCTDVTIWVREQPWDLWYYKYQYGCLTIIQTNQLLPSANLIGWFQISVLCSWTTDLKLQQWKLFIRYTCTEAQRW